MAYHAIACAAGGLLKARHDNLAEAIAATLHDLKYTCQTKRGLGSSALNGNLVDVIAYNHARSSKPTAIDVTVSNPMLPTYIAAALKDAEAIISKRDKGKTDKHGPGCEAQQRDFMSAVYTTFGGYGAKPFISLLEAEYKQLFEEAQDGGGTGYREAMKKARALQHLAAVLHRGSARMASQLTTGEEFEDGPAPPVPPPPMRGPSRDH